jgi:hypothetical protein
MTTVLRLRLAATVTQPHNLMPAAASHTKYQTAAPADLAPSLPNPVNPGDAHTLVHSPVCPLRDTLPPKKDKLWPVAAAPFSTCQQTNSEVLCSSPSSAASRASPAQQIAAVRTADAMLWHLLQAMPDCGTAPPYKHCNRQPPVHCSSLPYCLCVLAAAGTAVRQLLVAEIC